jgi:hypothetical protein
MVYLKYFRQKEYVSQENSTLYLAAPLYTKEEKWLCYPEIYCSPTSESYLSHFEIFKVQVKFPYVDIVLKSVNIESQKEQSYHWITFLFSD